MTLGSDTGGGGYRDEETVTISVDAPDPEHGIDDRDQAPKGDHGSLGSKERYTPPDTDSDSDAYVSMPPSRRELDAASTQMAPDTKVAPDTQSDEKMEIDQQFHASLTQRLEELNIPDSQATRTQGMSTPTQISYVDDMDLVKKMPGIYRVLDLISDQGSGGQVAKIVISQDSLRDFVETLHPGAYTSLTKVNFKALDKLSVRPVGVYGNREEIAKFLVSIGAIDDAIKSKLCRPEDDLSGVSEPTLSSGLYFVKPPEFSDTENKIYVVYWPEPTTWDDNAVSAVARNRVTFIRYLTKLCDQNIALISAECARDIVWHEEDDEPIDDISDFTDNDRIFTFTVAETNEQEENVTARPGLTLTSNRIKTNESPAQQSFPADMFKPKLVQGETSQGFMTMEFTPSAQAVRTLSAQSEYSSTHLCNLLASESVVLSDKLDDAALDAIIRLRPSRQWHEQCQTWKESMRHIQASSRAKQDEEDKIMIDELNRSLPQLTESLREAMIARVAQMYPTLSLGISGSVQTDGASTSPHGSDYLTSLFSRYEVVGQHYDKEFNDAQFNHLSAKEFRAVKLRFLVIQLALRQLRDLDAPAVLELIQNILAAEKVDQIKLALAQSLPSEDDQIPTEHPGVWERVGRYGKRVIDKVWQFSDALLTESDRIVEEARTLARTTGDDVFVRELDKFHAEDQTASQALINRIKTIAETNLQEKISLVLRSLPHRLLTLQIDYCRKYIKSMIAGEEGQAKALLDGDFMRVSPGVQPIDPYDRQVVIDHLEIENNRYRGRDSYRLSGHEYHLHDPVVRCAIYPFSLPSGEKEELQLNSTFVPKPVADTKQAILFDVPTQCANAHTQLLESNRVLVILISRGVVEEIEIYLEDSAAIKDSIDRRRHKKKFHASKIGDGVIFAFDESKRILAVCGTSKLQLHLYIFDESFRTLQAVATQVDLTQWYTEYNSRDQVKIQHACFVSGTEEIVLVDNHHRARIYSFVTRQFRPASVLLNNPPTKVWSSPDGSCLLVLTIQESTLTLTGYHTSTFGSSAGITLDLPDLPVDDVVLTSFVNRSTVHVLGLDIASSSCKSVVLDITSNVTEFAFTESKGNDKKGRHGGRPTVHNCLIDCHAEMWTRFPVQPAIGHGVISTTNLRHRKALLFVSDRNDYPFPAYFQHMIESFEKQTRKPTGNELSDLKIISALPETLPADLDDLLHASTLRVGEWLVGLLCLIPIHIAVCRENRFIPLKDGVNSGDLERSLLGADVSRIVDKLSFGWYESIFQSYLASMPVKVVSSMGEQSVGKSFALNHLADTSFAGSAMRTTEGVWLSVTPTAKNLIVALDFEGVHSIERSAQEDTFLVLFNTAISNLVLFRNNFALSRDITGLFQSFQSSASILDPAANPSLFQSTLLIIIKDVVDTDKSDITREFSLKIQRIVQEEQKSNFITRLHHGNLKIIPWPVIESAKFYLFFSKVRSLLDDQPTTHRTAGEFLHTMKTLMAKLKANDWGALSQTMAAHRAQTLLAHLMNALQAGLFEMQPEAEPLKNLDTDLLIEKPDSDALFNITGLPGATDEMDREATLVALQESWDGTSLRQYRPDSDWLQDFASHLNTLVDMRIDHVREWISVNVSRFQASHASIEDLRRAFNNACVELKASVQLCKAQCSVCQLLCIQGRLHEGAHSCKTNHKCIHDCGFCAKDSIEKPCGMVAGHPGKHVCTVTSHLCGEPCKMRDKRGCMEECTKALNHEDDIHMCSAPLHMCGQPCDLAEITLPDGKKWSCPGFCCVPSHEEHTIHKCEDRLCPVTCQLCKQLCKEEHLHGLEAGAKHLCGQEHSCNALCADPGICQIETHPHSIEATFTGKHETFQYTKYTQAAKRLDCIKRIPPDQTEHDGSHCHSSEESPFHFCESRCDHCGYYCTLRLDHFRPHSARTRDFAWLNGRARWAIDSPDGTVEHEGRKFSTNDDGAPMMCNLVCTSMGRHVHIDWCRTEPDEPCEGAEVEHIPEQFLPEPNRPKDYITHGLYWRRTGFKDPYSREEQTNFAKCDSMCPGSEHAATATNPAQPSFCTLPLFHPAQANAHPDMGYVSPVGGHHFTCQNPAVMLPAPLHVIFVIDRSGSMTSQDRRPLRDAPATNRIKRVCNNRLGAVFSALYSFWTARDAAAMHGAPAPAPARQDAYSIIFFDENTTTPVVDDTTSSPDDLLNAILNTRAYGRTNFAVALQATRVVMERNWNADRNPIVIFLSDGQCALRDAAVETLCRAALRRGKPLSLQSISFGPDAASGSLRRMAQVALAVQNEAPVDTNGRTYTPSAFHQALSTVNLAETFLAIAETLRKPRGSLLR
ncbi:hypothetical protein EVG20_g2356 [Dentipellis fragilis]|uniref:VWFA domain-containing protein n=1 Tax=Dentipellis fragilis TaxID=205917 RepID=A0A4Y9Z715_9AGAM|nr:hypothetical protein EVG20_g2356 [Dentipellis fragilis]